MVLERLQQLIIAKDNPSTPEHSLRTALAAVVSLLVARLFRLPETYWAAISALIVMQSSLGAALPISVERFAGTALGAVAGGLFSSYVPGAVAAFGGAVLAIGLLCAALKIQRSAYRYASITLAIVMLVPRTSNGWVIATHRFCEVSIGIIVGLALSAMWPERTSGQAQHIDDSISDLGAAEGT